MNFDSGIAGFLYRIQESSLTRAPFPVGRGGQSTKSSLLGSVRDDRKNVASRDSVGSRDATLTSPPPESLIGMKLRSRVTSCL